MFFMPCSSAACAPLPRCALTFGSASILFKYPYTRSRVASISLFAPVNNSVVSHRMQPKIAIAAASPPSEARHSAQLRTIFPVKSPLSISSCARTHSRAGNTLCTCDSCVRQKRQKTRCAKRQTCADALWRQAAWSRTEATRFSTGQRTMRPESIQCYRRCTVAGAVWGAALPSAVETGGAGGSR